MINSGTVAPQSSVASGEAGAAAGVAKLRRLAATMCCVVAIGGALAELMLAWVWIWPENVQLFVAPRLGLAVSLDKLDVATRLGGFAVTMVPLGVLFYALHQAYELFDAYRKGEVFPEAAPRRLRQIGLAMVALGVMRPFVGAALGLVLTAGNPPGQRMLVIGFSIEDYMIAAFGGLILAIAHVALEAKRLADEHSQIV